MHRSESPLPCRLLVEGADAGPRQMAVDEVLLEGAAEGRATLRFYRWSQPTLSLGYFQSASARRSHLASRACPLVRRQTGGGAILHDVELTYSLAIPRAHGLTGDSTFLYEAVHDAVIDVLSTFGVAARRRTAAEEIRGAAQPFLCFQRRTWGDVLLGDDKVCGSAQRRRRGAILQHGSLLLARSACAPELPGINEAGGVELDALELAKKWGPAIAGRLALKLSEAPLSTAERQAAERLKREKYDLDPWNRRR